MKRLVRIAIVADVAIAIFLIALAIWLGAEWLGAAATAIQAVFIVAALAVAAGTLLSDSRDRRVDRVIALHSELTSGELQEARIRFVNHLRRHGCHGRVRQVYRHELATDRSSQGTVATGSTSHEKT
jgi:uncharacterized protein (DUF58 family)